MFAVVDADQESLARHAEPDPNCPVKSWGRSPEFLEFRNLNHLTSFTIQKFGLAMNDLNE